MIKYRAETFMKGQKVEGLYYKEAGVEGKHIIRSCYNAVDYYVIPETLEIFLFGEWRLVSELDKPCKWKLKKDRCGHISYDTDCGHTIEYIGYELEETIKHCCFCSRPIMGV